MIYNSQRPPLIIPEYGRNVQNMVDYAVSIEDKEHRNKVAHSIIDVMGNLNPHLRDVPDFKHKLWDHLFIMSRFELEVDSPYPVPSPESFEEKPRKVDYPGERIKYRHYGRTIEGMIRVAAEMEEGEYREGLIKTIANHMKKCYLVWNKDTVEDDTIWKHLEELSEGKIKQPEEDVNLISRSQVMKHSRPQHNQQNKKRKKTNRKGGRNYNR